MNIPTRNDIKLSPFPEPVEGLHFVRDGHEKKGRPFDKLRERAFAMSQSQRALNAFGAVPWVVRKTADQPASEYRNGGIGKIIGMQLEIIAIAIINRHVIGHTQTSIG